MTTSDSGEPRRIPNTEQLPCPRCGSTNTKFCYYNNYNFSQPRHFCKGCRRYWTQGGTLRDIPVGGGTRKSAKRAKTCSPSSSSSPVSSRNVPFPPPLDNGAKGSTALSLCGNFTSLLSNHNAAVTVGHRSGFGSGFEDVSFGLGRAMWPFSTAGDAGTTVPMPATWQFEGLEGGGFASGENFAWPDLSITTPGNKLD